MTPSPKLEMVAIGTLKVDPQNVRSHSARNVQAIKTFLAEYGQQKPVVANVEGVVIAGNGVLMAAKELGWTHMMVIRTALDPKKQRQYAVADNRATDLSEFNDQYLISVLKDYPDELPAMGFTDDELQKLLKETTEVPAKTKVDVTTHVKCPKCGHDISIKKSGKNREPAEA